MTTETIDAELLLQIAEDELKDIYRDRQDTAVQVQPSGIRLSRAGRAIRVMVGVTGARASSQNVDIRIQRLSNAFERDLNDKLFVLILAAAGFLAWRYHVGDPNAELYQWTVLVVVMAVLGTLSAVGLRDRKENEKVFSQSEVDRIQTRLRLRLGSSQ